MNSKLQVLVIDDDAVVGRSFDRVLSDKGYEVSTVLSGEEAMHSIEESKYDVVFTDIKMPGMDGLEVTERIKERCPWTPVVVITGYGTEENESRAAVLGASGFVRKPLTPEIIESVTLKALSEPEVIPETAEPANEAAIVVEEAVEEEQVEVQGREISRKAKNVGLFFASPFIALGYVIALPIVGFYQFIKLAREASNQKKAAK
ncbi:MAG: response regulator [Xanthomonadales bacterium]|nr:response regulator [Xanthomonadales bacterium]